MADRVATAEMTWRTHSGGSLNSKKAQNTLASTKNFSQLSLQPESHSWSPSHAHSCLLAG